MIDKTIKKLPVTEMIRCEVSGKLYPVEDCEVVVIKIIKAKEVDLNGYNPFPEPRNAPEAPFVASAPKVAPTSVVASHSDPTVLTEADVTRAPARKPIVPPALIGMMLPPDHPSFESRGSKIYRKT